MTTSYSQLLDLPECCIVPGFKPDVVSQGDRGTCAVFSTISLLEFYLQNEKKLSQQYLYACCKLSEDERFVNEEGTSIEHVFNCVQDFGLISAEEWPYNPGLTDDEAQISLERLSGFSPFYLEDVRFHMLYTPKNVDEIRGILAGKNGFKPMPVVVGCEMYSPELIENDWLEMPSPWSKPSGGHAMLIFGYSAASHIPGGGYFLAQNSWGAKWHQNNSGILKIPYEYIRTQASAAGTLLVPQKESHKSVPDNETEHFDIEALERFMQNELNLSKDKSPKVAIASGSGNAVISGTETQSPEKKRSTVVAGKTFREGREAEDTVFSFVNTGESHAVIRKITDKIYGSEEENIFKISRSTQGVFVEKASVENCIGSRLKHADCAVYYISPLLYKIFFSTTFYHPECPGGGEISLELDVKITPLASDFGDWLLGENIEFLEKETFAALLQQEEYGLKRYVQKIVNSHPRIQPLLQYAGEIIDESFLGHHEALPQWLWVQMVKCGHIRILPTETEKRNQKFAREQDLLDQEIEEKNRILAHEVNLRNIEQTRKELQMEALRREQEREDALKIARAQKEIELAAAETQKRRAVLEKEAELSELETQSKVSAARQQMALLEAEHKKQLFIARQQIALQKIENQKKVLAAQLEAELLEIENKKKNSVLHQEEEISKQVRLLKKEQELQELEAQKIREEMNRSEAVFQAQSAVITGREQSKVRTVEEVEICYGEIVEDIEGRIAAAEEQKAEIFYNISSESLIELVRKQQERCPVVLKKVKAETTALQVRSRDICLKIKTERLNIGDDMKFSFKSSRSGYITLLCFGTSCLPAADFGGVGKVSVLEPNFLDGVCRVEAGREYLLPGDHFLAGQYLAQEGPAGVERICAIVTDKPLLRVPAGLEDFDQLSRAELASLAADLSLFPGESWAGGYLSYRVE